MDKASISLVSENITDLRKAPDLFRGAFSYNEHKESKNKTLMNGIIIPLISLLKKTIFIVDIHVYSCIFVSNSITIFIREINMNTYATKPSDIERKWYVVDAEGVVLGRMAAQIAKILQGKNKPSYVPNLDCGDYVVVINADKVKLTGKKLTAKKYFKHTGWIGGIKETTAGKVLSGRFPERVVEKAVERMISRNPMGRQQMTKLKVYAGSEHPHTAQNPEVLDIASWNEKNKRSAL